MRVLRWLWLWLWLWSWLWTWLGQVDGYGVPWAFVCRNRPPHPLHRHMQGHVFDSRAGSIGALERALKEPLSEGWLWVRPPGGLWAVGETSWRAVERVTGLRVAGHATCFCP